MEIANAYACRLWRHGRHVEAVRVWGEVHLPLAPPTYWDIFVTRLEAADKLHLIVKWLPFNDRTKVAHGIYERLLNTALEREEPFTLLARIVRWPVLYKIAPIQRRILAALDGMDREGRLCAGLDFVLCGG